jgi:hypothetical protein
MPFDILPDPRIKTAPPISRRSQFSIAISCQARRRQRTINDIDATPRQVASLTRRMKNGSANLRKPRRIAPELPPSGLIDVNMSRAHTAAGCTKTQRAVRHRRQRQTSAPARQTRRCLPCTGQLDTLLAKWRKARVRLLPALNRTAAKAKLPVIG